MPYVYVDETSNRPSPVHLVDPHIKDLVSTTVESYAFKRCEK